MNFDLSETQQLFNNTADRFLRDVDVTEREKIRSSDSGYDRERWTQLSELGLLSIAVDESMDGLDGSISDMAVIAECFGKNNACDPWLENGILPLRLANKAQHSDIVATLSDGSSVAALAHAEENSRYRLMPESTIATTEGDNYIVSGSKHFVVGGAIADTLFVTALCDGDFSIFSIPKNSDGVSADYYRIADGSHAADIAFDKVKVAADQKLDLEFEDYKKVVGELNLLFSAEMLGLSQRLLDDTIAYVKEREQFKVPISSFQVIQHVMVDCYSELEQMRSLLLRTVLLSDESAEQWFGEIAGAKSFIAERADKIARDAVQYHGAMGITDEVEIGHAMKRVMMLTRMFGCPATNLKQYMDAA